MSELVDILNKLGEQTLFAPEDDQDDLVPGIIIISPSKESDESNGG